MLPDETVTKAADAFLNADPVLGAVIVVLLAVVVYLGKMLKDTLKAVNDEKDKRLDDAKAYSKDAETTRNQLAANTNAIASNTAVMQSVLSDRRQ